MKSSETPAVKDFTRSNFISFNPLGLAEPQMALGVGYGSWFSRRSEFFGEASYVRNQWFYNDRTSFNGIRIIGQYKYHRWHNSKKSFVGIDLRLKTVYFKDNADFTNTVSNDTLHNFLFKARSNVPGAAIIFGRQFKISPEGKWYIDFTVGIGAKQKFVRYRNVAEGYKRIFYYNRGPALPQQDEEIASAYFPFGLRLCYKIN